MHWFQSELRVLLRRLVKDPLFTITTVLTLALGIAANTAIFSVVDGVLLEPLPYESPEELVGIWHTAPGLDMPLVNQSPALHFTYREDGESFEDVAIYRFVQVPVTGEADPEQLRALLVSASLFPVLRVQPLVGRLFSEEDDLPGSAETVVLSYAYWQRHFGGESDAVGRSLRISGRPCEIIGVLPPGFSLLDVDAELFLPLQLDRTEVFVGNFSFNGLARLEPGVSLEQANAEVNRLTPVATERFPGGVTQQLLDQARFAAALRPLKEDLVGDVGQVLWVLLGTVGVVLLIACANVANLFLVRAEGRHREVALRQALGAGRRTVAGSFLLESVTLGLLGGTIGVGLAAVALELLRRVGPEGLPRLDEIALDGRALLFSLILSLLVGVLFGLVPVARLRSDLVDGLRDGSRGAGTGRQRHRLRAALVVAQVGLALVLLVGSGLMMRSFAALRDVDPGFDRPEEVLTFALNVPQAEVEDPIETYQLLARIESELERLPGVVSVGSTSSVTMDGRRSMDPIFFQDRPLQENELPPLRHFKYITEGYLPTMGIPVVAGRGLERSDLEERRPVVVITENLAREVWGEPTAALGRHLRTLAPNGDEGLEMGGGGPWREVVGVVGNVADDGVSQPAPSVVFWPAAMNEYFGEEVHVPRSMVYVLRTAGVSPSSLVPQVRQAVWSVSRNLPLADVRTLAEILRRSLQRTSFTLLMLGLAAAVALLLGMVGIYGVLSYVVSQRRHEIGVRMALGARRASVSAMTIRSGLLLTVAGIGLGLLAAFALSRLLENLLFGIAATDPITFVAVSLGLALVAFFASFLASLRATGVDPIEALRVE